LSHLVFEIGASSRNRLSSVSHSFRTTAFAISKGHSGGRRLLQRICPGCPGSVRQLHGIFAIVHNMYRSYNPINMLITHESNRAANQPVNRHRSLHHSSSVHSQSLLLNPSLTAAKRMKRNFLRFPPLIRVHDG